MSDARQIGSRAPRLLAVLLGAALVSTPAFGAETETSSGILSILPPLIAIGLALALREVLIALVAAVFAGALFLADWNPITAFARTIDRHVLEALADSDHASILIFSALLGAMVGVLGRSGGTKGIVELILPRATNRRRGQLSTWFMGLVVFFDDYANTLLVGSTMRPLTDRLRISREKLAYIVDSTAAPIASLVPISTWIGFEVGLLQEAFDDLSLARDGFTTVVASIPYRSYQIYALLLGLLIAATQRDFGPMVSAERRAAKGRVVDEGDTALAEFDSDSFSPPAGRPALARNAIVPLVVVVSVTLLGLITTGSAGLVIPDGQSLGTTLREIFANSDSYKALLWSSFAGVLAALACASLTRALKLSEGLSAAVGGVKASLLAYLVLILAWALASVCEDLGTAQYLVQIAEGELAPQLIPALTFVLAAAIAFSTGTAWGTMGIMTPLVVPLAHHLAVGAGLDPSGSAYTAVLLGTVAAVLGGSVWGDHCSPISDTTILSSMASGCDHVAHVKTQIPYAACAGLAAVTIGLLATGYGLNPWVSLLLGAACLTGLVFGIGKRAPAEAGAG